MEVCLSARQIVAAHMQMNDLTRLQTGDRGMSISFSARTMIRPHCHMVLTII